jgi:Ca2+-binding RTX toxin-like protein
LVGAQSLSVADEAGEAEAKSAGLSGGTRQSRWEGSMRFAAFEPTEQPGLAVDASPDRGDGQRMSLARITDTPQGLAVAVFDVTDNGPGNAVGFPETVVASGLDRAVAHTLGFVVDYVDGPANDVVRVYVDGALVHTTGTWEQYFRNDPEQAANNNEVPTADELLVAVRGNSVPAVLNKGLFVDDVAVRSSTPAPPPGPTPPPPPPPAPAPPAPDVPQGGAGADSITGSQGPDRIAGGGGDDRVNGGADNDYLLGEAGDDRLFGADGNDALNGGTGADRFSGQGGNDRFSGGAGNDSIDGGSGADLLSGNGGRDTIRGGSGDDRIKARDDRLDRISCGGGDDVVQADRGDRVAADCEEVRRG